VQVIHAHMTAAEIPAALLKRNARLIVTRHFASPRGSTRLARASRPLLRRRIDSQIAISQFVADRVEGECVVIHNAVSDGADRTAERGKTVLVLQRLEQEKDTPIAIRAWAISRLADNGWRMVIRGRGSQEMTLRQLAANEGVEASVEFPGFTRDPRRALAAATVLLATAPAEPFGLAVVEAMAEGTVVVAADGGAHRETLGDAGVFFPAGDPTSCAEALRRATGDAALQIRLAAAGRARQREEFRIDHHADRIEQVYFG
jgi:glycosyltransferase involved in cell wall biosynthesis